MKKQMLVYFLSFVVVIFSGCKVNGMYYDEEIISNLRQQALIDRKDTKETREEAEIIQEKAKIVLEERKESNMLSTSAPKTQTEQKNNFHLSASHPFNETHEAIFSQNGNKATEDVLDFLSVATNGVYYAGKETARNGVYDVYMYDCENSGKQFDIHNDSGYAKDFVEILLSKYPFSLFKHYIEDRTGADGVVYAENTYYSETWVLNYTGSKNIQKFYSYGQNLEEIYGHVHVVRRDHIFNNKRSYYIMISKGLSYGGDYSR